MRWIAASILLLAALPAAGVEGRKVLIMDLEANGLDKGVASQAASLAADALQGRPGLSVTTMREVREMLEHQGRQDSVGCAPGKPCSQDLAGAAHASELLTGTLGKVGGSHTLSMTLMDVKSASVKGKADATFKTMKELPKAIRDVVQKLFGVDTAPVAAPPAAGKGKGKASFAVMDLQANGVPVGVAASLTQVLSAELKRMEGNSVISRDDITAMMQLEEMKSKTGCDDMSCLAEIGGALGVENLVTGSVGKLADSHVVSLQLISVRDVRVVQRVTETFQGPEDQLLHAVRHAARSLTGQGSHDVGLLAVSATESNAAVYVDNKPAGQLPQKPLEGLTPGPHALKVDKSGFFEWVGDVYVNPGETTALFVELQQRPLRWYQRWWVWTILGVTGVGVAVLSVAVLGLAGAGAFALIQYLQAPTPDAGSGRATAR